MQKAVRHLATALCTSRPNISFLPVELGESPVLMDCSYQRTLKRSSKLSKKFLAVNTLLYYMCKNWTYVNCQYNVLNKNIGCFLISWTYVYDLKQVA